MYLHRIAATAFLTATAFCSVANARPDTAPASAALQKCIADEAANNNFSGVISITRPGGGVSHAQGLIAPSGSDRISVETQFNLGSAGKMFTAVAVAQLVDAKKIGLDDPIGRYVSGLTREAEAVTIRQLLTHSGGLGNFFSPDNLPMLQKAQSLSDLKPLLIGDKPAFTPGSRFEYSNSGFLLLGLMVEQVSGLSYADYLQRHIFTPWGMTGSSLAPSKLPRRAVGMTTMPELPPSGAVGMQPPPGTAGGPPTGVPIMLAPPPGANGMPVPGAPNGPMMMPPPGPLRPAAEAALMGNSAGASYSSGPDMQRFFAAFMAGKLTSPALRDMLMSPQIEVSPAKDGAPARSHGLGFGVGTYKGHRWTGHNGGTLGVNVEMMAFPDDQTTVVIMANRDPPVATALIRKVLEILFNGASCEPR